MKTTTATPVLPCSIFSRKAPWLLPAVAACAICLVSGGSARAGDHSPAEAPDTPTAAIAAVPADFGLPPDGATVDELEDALARLEARRDALDAGGGDSSDPPRPEIDGAIAALEKRIEAALAEQSRKAREEALAGRRAGASRAAAMRDLSVTEKTLDALAGVCAATSADKFAAAALRRAERARKDARAKREAGRYEDAAKGYESAKAHYEAAIAEARAANAAAEVESARAYKEANLWQECLDAAREALNWEPGNEDAAALKAEAEQNLAALEQERKGPVSGAHAGDLLAVAVGGVSFNMRWCPPGSFTMGSPASEQGRDTDETQHAVTLTQGFWMGETEVTQALWREVMGGNPANAKTDGSHPVEQVSWNNCLEFIGRLNARPEAQDAGQTFSFPTEAQWEYACRAGTTGPYGGTGSLDDMGWYASNSGGKTHPVAQKKPNDWGLYDMHGNIWEWCSDWFGDYPKEAQTDPRGPASGVLRVARGGSWIHPARGCRSAFREWYAPGDRDGSLGLRLVLVPDRETGGDLP